MPAKLSNGDAEPKRKNEPHHKCFSAPHARRGCRCPTREHQQSQCFSTSLFSFGLGREHSIAQAHYCREEDLRLA